MSLPKEIEKLIRYDRLYYNDGKSDISDVEYDKLYEEVKKKYPEHSYFKKVGSEVEGDKVKLLYVLGSLKKTNILTLKGWFEKRKNIQNYFANEKLDGIDIFVRYENGKPVFAATRGDGFYGQDITEKAKIFCPDIKFKYRLDVRGQAMLLEDLKGYKTRRNAAGGIINRDDTTGCDKIVPFFFEVLNYDEMLFKSRDEEYYFLHSNFPNTPESRIITTTNIDELVVDMIEWLKTRKNESPYEIDGIVIYPYQYERENVEYPEDKVAFKINEEAKEVIVERVEWRTTRTGRIIPLVHVQPTEIQGVTIKKATGFNAEFIKNQKIGSGSIIELERANDVIPYIVGIKSKVDEELPEVCPSCGDKLEWNGVDLVCKKSDCWSQAYKKTEHFLIHMGVENITEKTLMKLGLDSVEKCYDIDEWEISETEGFGLKRAEQIVYEFQKILNTTPEILLSSFGIKGVGRTTSKLILNYLKEKNLSSNEVMNYLMNDITYEELVDIKGIGEMTARNYVDKIHEFKELFYFLLSKGLKFKETEKGEGKTNETIFTLTGKGPLERKEIQRLIEENGGYVKSISKNTAYLVTNDMESKSSKTKKAKQYNIPIISYENLFEMLGIEI